jgi:heme O synthase-like polyprenyltransferase
MRRKTYRFLVGVTSAVFNLIISALTGFAALILSIHSGEYSTIASMLIGFGFSSYSAMMIQMFTSLGIEKQMERLDSRNYFSDQTNSTTEKEMDQKALETIEELTKRIEKEINE